MAPSDGSRLLRLVRTPEAIRKLLQAKLMASDRWVVLGLRIELPLNPIWKVARSPAAVS